MNRVLIIGNSHDKHLSRFIKGLRAINVDFTIDILDVSMRQDICERGDLYDNVYISKRKYPAIAYKIPLINKYLKYRDTVKAFCKIAKEYSVISVQFITIQAGFLTPYLKKYGAKLIVTPWGSDIYRIGSIQRYFTRKLLSTADYITLMPSSKFGYDVKSEYNIPDNRCLPLCFGSDVLDAILKDKQSKEECKYKLLSNSECFTIVIGYNASPAQNHLKVIKALESIKTLLPKNTKLLLPMTYAKIDSYMQEVRTTLDISGFDFMVFDSYLTDAQVVMLRKASDIFVHMQKTDAYSSSLQEALLCGSKVVNAEWLRYKELEINGVPYVLANFENLSLKIMEVLSCNETNMDVSSILKSYTWSYQLQEWNNVFTKI